MRDIQKEFDSISFESLIINKVSNEEDKKLLQNFYQKDPIDDKYKLKEKIKEIDIDKLGRIFDSVGFLPDVKKEELKKNYKKIERYFLLKQKAFENYKHIPVEEIINNSPKYYAFIRLIEQLNSFINKDPNWLKEFVAKNKVKFDWNSYSKWKSGQDFYKITYNDTYSPSKWINLVQDKLIEIIKSLQILLYMEFYIEENVFKRFLKMNVEVDYKMKANYIKKSLPSEDIEILFNVVDYLLKLNVENDFTKNLVIDTTVCFKAYRFIDESGIFDLLKRKEFYVKYHLEFLNKMPTKERIIIPCEHDIVSVATNFLEGLKDLFFTYKEYKDRLIEKYNKIKSKIKF